MLFEKQKKAVLEKLKGLDAGKKDKSKKGSVDIEIVPLVNTLNALSDYYTTSSCSGRIVLIELPSRRKDAASWLFSSHSVVVGDTKTQFFSVVEELRKKKDNNPIWFKEEPFILHVACKDMDSAQELVDIAQSAGAKHTGIIASQKKVVVEVMSTDIIQVPLIKEGAVALDNPFLDFLLDEANAKLMETRKKMAKLQEAILKL